MPSWTRVSDILAPDPGREDVVVAGGPPVPPLSSEAQFAPETPLRAALAAFRSHRLAMLGAGIVVFLLLFCFVGPLIYQTDQKDTNLLELTLRPSWHHPLGTDDLGHDVLGRLMVGGQVTLEVAFGGAAVAIVIGVLIGAIAGLTGGVLDAFLMRIVDALLCIPFLVLLLFLGSITRPSIPLLIGLIGAFAWIGPARFVRGETLSLRERDFVHAVRLMGGSRRRIVGRHIVPNTIGTIMVNVTFQIADIVLAIAALSYLGLGLPPPTATWGDMLSRGLNYSFSGYWWLIYPAGIAILLTVVAFNLIGDGLHDALEVRLRD
jgi:peptide/nickel transport system permease protein